MGSKRFWKSEFNAGATLDSKGSSILTGAESSNLKTSYIQEKIDSSVDPLIIVISKNKKKKAELAAAQTEESEETETVEEVSEETTEQ